MSGNPGCVAWGSLNAATGLPRQGETVVQSKLKPCEGGEPFSCEGFGKPRGMGLAFFLAVAGFATERLSG